MHVNERNQNKKSCLIQIETSFHFLIYPTNNAMVSLKDGFTVWRQSQKEDFLPVISYINVWLSMLSGHRANPIFFNKKDKDWTSTPLRPITSHFCLTPLRPLTSKVDAICISLPILVSTVKLIIISKFRTLKFWINHGLIFLFFTFIQCGNSFIQ